MLARYLKFIQLAASCCHLPPVRPEQNRLVVWARLSGINYDTNYSTCCSHCS